MEKRMAKLNVNTPGGTAGRGGKTYKVTLPTSWIEAMQLDSNHREVELLFDGNQILITRRQTVETFYKSKRALGHTLYRFRFFDGDTLCTEIAADFSDKTLVCQNYTDNLVKTAFGKKNLPVWEDFEAFLQERCIPKERAGLREYLETLELDEYNPLNIILKTNGRMAEDQQWLEVCSE